MAVSLPEDIQFLVIEAYTSQCTVEDALRLLTVSRTVKSWAEPHSYSKVTIKTKGQAYQFSLAVREELPFCRPARHVKQLRILCYTDEFIEDYFFWGVHGVLERCLNLVHLAFDGKVAPFTEYGQVSNDVWPNLTRLSICSSYWINNNFRTIQRLVPWDRLKHLHIFGPIHDWLLHESLLGSGSCIDQFTSLESLYIDLRYPEDVPEDVDYHDRPEGTFFRKLFNRLPRLRRVAIKTYFTSRKCQNYWNNLMKNMKDEPRIVFEISKHPLQDFYVRSIMDDCRPEINTMTVQYRLIRTLDELNRLWDAEN